MTQFDRFEKKKKIVALLFLTPRNSNKNLAELNIVLSYNFSKVLYKIVHKLYTKLNFECPKHNTIIVFMNTNDWNCV